jgi:YD repeat-containing protein
MVARLRDSILPVKKIRVASPFRGPMARSGTVGESSISAVEADFFYDGAGRATLTAYSNGAGTLDSFSNSYDLAGDLTAASSYLGFSADFGYDSQGQLTSDSSGGYAYVAAIVQEINWELIFSKEKNEIGGKLELKETGWGRNGDGEGLKTTDLPTQQALKNWTAKGFYLPSDILRPIGLPDAKGTFPLRPGYK